MLSKIKDFVITSGCAFCRIIIRFYLNLSSLSSRSDVLHVRSTWNLSMSILSILACRVIPTFTLSSGFLTTLSLIFLVCINPFRLFSSLTLIPIGEPGQLPASKWLHTCSIQRTKCSWSLIHHNIINIGHVHKYAHRLFNISTDRKKPTL